MSSVMICWPPRYNAHRRRDPVCNALFGISHIRAAFDDKTEATGFAMASAALGCPTPASTSTWRVVQVIICRPSLTASGRTTFALGGIKIK